MTNRPLKFVLAMVVVGVFASCATASTILIGAAPVAPDVFLTTATGTTVASISGNLFGVGGLLNGTYSEKVIADDGANNCLGCLDFLISVSSTGPDTIQRITTSNFGGPSVTTDVGFVLGSGGVVPDTVDRTADSHGSHVGFNYAVPNGLPPGSISPQLEIFTNAFTVSSGNISIIDGDVATSRAFGVGVPEPSSVGLMFLGLLGLAAAAHRFKN